jgi:hypothetical protein
MVTFGYSLTVPPAQATSHELTLLAASFGKLPAPSSSATAKILLASLRLTPGTIRLAPGGSLHVRLSGLMSNGSPAPKRSLKNADWRTGSTAVATVTSSGLVTAVAPGRTTVSVTDGSARDSAQIIVASPPAPGETQTAPSPSTGGGQSSSPPPSGGSKPTPFPTLTPSPL